MFYQASLLNIPSAISSPESEHGLTRSEAQDMTDGTKLHGQEVAPVNLSARQAKEKGLLTSGTYGQRGSISSNSEDLMLSLVSRLKVKTDVLGSTLFKLTWKQVTMPSGRSVCVLRASARRISGQDCSSWPTPRVTTNGGYGNPERGMDGGNSRLEDTVQLAAWPTPLVPNGGRQPKDGLMSPTGQTPDGKKRQVDLNFAAKLAAWPTPCQQDGPKGGPNQGVDRLPGAANLAGWATPAARDFKSESATDEFNQEHWEHPRGKPLSAEVLLTDSGEVSNGSTAETKSTGQLNPAHSRWLMGLPEEWDIAAILAYRSLRQRKRA